MRLTAGTRVDAMFEESSLSTTKICTGKWCNGGRQFLNCTVGKEVQFCSHCYHRMQEQVTSLPTLYDTLAQVMLPSPRWPFGRKRGSRGTSGIPIDEDAVSCRSEILVFLRSWSALIADECSVRKPIGHDCDTLAPFLSDHLGWLLRHPAASEFEEQLYALVVRSRQIADSAPRRFEIGSCVWPGCDGRLFPVTSVSNGKPEIHCGAGHAWQADQWLQLYRQLQGV